MTKSIEEMSEDEIIAGITKLREIRVPASKPKSVGRLESAPKKKKDPSKRTWKDDFFGE